TTTNLYENAFSYWISMRHNLHQAFQEFFNACQLLDNAGQSRHRVDAQTRQVMSHHLEEEISSLSSLQHSIQSAKGTLVRARNNSVALVPINMLPLEVLSDIFTLGQQHCVHNMVTQYHAQTAAFRLVDVLSRVCTNWRRVSLNIRELWSHIDLIMNTDHELFGALCGRAELWLKRARGCPLHIHLHELRGDGDTDDGPSEHGYTTHEDIKRILNQNLRHVVSVQLWSDTGYPFEDFPWELFDTRIYESQAPLHNFSIFNWSDRTGLIKIPDRRFACFSRPVSMLHLYGVAVPWGSRVCHGLTELCLEYLQPNVAPTLAQIANILTASPRLRLLTLVDVDINLNLPYHGDPIPLYDLEALNFRWLGSGSLRYVLPLLAPGPRPLSMSVCCRDKDSFDKGVEAFFERSNVTTLFVAYLCRSTWYPLPRSLRMSLQVLAIIGSTFLSDEEPNIISTNTDNLMPHESTICPNLRELHLLCSVLRPDLLFPMVAVHSIEELWLSGPCQLHNTPSQSEPGDLTGPRTIQELTNLMSEVVQSVRQVDKYNDDPASRWDFVQ
ncbi:hypothetical protein FRC08_015812, partial [Ceratobasidium sp. 394]